MYRLEILKKDQNTIIYVYENDKLVESYSERIEEPRLEGNIYLGIVKDVVPGMQSAFIDIGEKKTALIHINDLIPKISDTTGNLNLDISKYKGLYLIVAVHRLHLVGIHSFQCISYMTIA